jgi:predicted ATPase
MTSQGSRADEGVPLLNEQGENVPALIDYFLRRDRARLEAFVEQARRFIPGFHDIGILTPDPATRQIELVVEDNLRIPADRSSVGVRLMLFFLALSFHPDLPELVLIEEPEKGVHPRRLEDIVNLLKELTNRSTTHSPYLLDFIDPAQEQVLVFSRAEDGRRNIEGADAGRLKHFLDEFQLGEVWYNKGEEGLVRPESK